MTKRPPKKGLVDVVGASYSVTPLGLAHIEQMAALGAKVPQIAQYLRVSEDFLRTSIDSENSRYDPSIDAAFNDGQAVFKKRLLEAQQNLSETNAQMAIHLGKQHLDQREEPVEHHHRVQVVGTLPDYSMGADDWGRQFAPSALQPAIPAKPDRESAVDAEIVGERD